MYQALYREYRPKTFDSLLGQEHITTTLKNQINNENIGHAYLFSGTRGTGKTSAAKIFARAVNCLDSEDGNPCNKCENCLEILEEASMDVIEMDAASHNSVDDIRNLRDKVVYPPAKIKYKVYIIDEVHMLSKGAFNALLKTLEEPPSHLIFILATTEPERLPATILSRCQRFDFKRITNKDIIKNMEYIVDDLGVDIDQEVLRLIARNSDGAMRDALSLLDQCISYDQERISYEDAIDILGVTNIDLIFGLVDSILDEKLEESLLTIDEIVQEGKDIDQFIKDLISHFRNLMILKSSQDPDSILEIDNIARYKEQAGKTDLDYIMNILDLLTEAEGKSKWSSQSRIILEMAIIKMVEMRKNLSLEERVARLEAGYIPRKSEEVASNDLKREEGQARPRTSRPAPKSKKAAHSPRKTEKKVLKEKPVINPEEDIDIDTIKKNWNNILENIRLKRVSLYALIMEGGLVSYENNLLTIGYDDGFGFHKEAISSPENTEFVEGIVSNYFGRDIKLNFIMGKKKVDRSQIDPMEVKEKEVNLEESIEKAVDLFGEDIVKIK